VSAEATVLVSHERTWFDRLAAAYPLVVGYVVLLMLYGWQVSKHSAPWNFVDELQWAALSRGVAHTGRPELRSHPAALHSLYTYFLAPAWWFGTTGKGYAAAKYLNVCAAAATLFPAYGLARSFVGRGAAVVVAFAAATTPAVAYAGMLIPESLAYFWSALVLWLVARALLQPRRATVVAAIVTLLLAPIVRSELAVLFPAALVAAAFAFGGSSRGRRLIGSWTTRERIGAATLVFLALVWLGSFISHHSISWEIGTAYHHRMITYGLWAVGAYTIGVGILPAVVSVAWALGARCRAYDECVLLGLLVGTVATFVVYTAVKASYISTNFAIRVEERNLIYLSPLVFTVTARWFVQGRFLPWAWALSVGGVGYLIATTPYHAYEHLYSDALGLAILEWLNRTWYFTNTDLKRLLFGILAATLALGVATALVRRRGADRRFAAAAVGLAGLVAVLVVGWNLTGEIAAANASNSIAKTFRDQLPEPPDWIDRATGRARTMFLGESLGGTNSNALWSIEFWNQSIGDVWSVDASVPPPGPGITPNFTSLDGEVAPQIPARYGVTTRGVDLVGPIVEKAGGLVLRRLTRPIRIADSALGVTPDGWMSTSAQYNRFAPPNARPGVASVVLTRAAACGNVPASNITIRLSKLRLDRNSQPRAGKPLAVRRTTVRSTPCETKTISIPVTPPFHIDVTADPTFQPSPSDPRQLSVQIGFGFKPNAR
jgi:hypothetical protein